MRVKTLPWMPSMVAMPPVRGFAQSSSPIMYLPPVLLRAPQEFVFRDELPRVGPEVGALGDRHFREDAIPRVRNPRRPNLQIPLVGGLALRRGDGRRHYDSQEVIP